MSNPLAAGGRAAEVNARYRPVRIADGVVTRPAGPSSPTVHAYLRHLRAAGLTCVPEPIGLSGGVETLRLLEGESGGDGWYHQHTDEGLASAARLLRTVHDAGKDWVPPGDATWGAPPVDGPDLVHSHGDVGPWNVVWRDRQAVGLIDWDYLHPGPRLDDVAYALRWFVPLRSDALALEWHHFPAVPDRRSRIAVFCEAYGDLPDFDVVEVVTARMEATRVLMAELARRGQEPQRTWVDEGALDREAAEIAWIRGHAADFA
ncbi:phosphotransferase [Auraticoccus cholistanensis]|uniref:phosphotransferase n=1 Tax=Auraticoccus cholistanensis TaxID=2656650 RepID=UPI0018D22BA4